VGWEDGKRNNSAVIEYPNLVVAVPGDIVYYYSKEGYHVSIIQYKNCNNNEQLQLIGIIESVCGKYGRNGGDLYSIATIRTIDNLRLLEKKWIIGRILQ
jgi:hypothetical protein